MPFKPTLKALMGLIHRILHRYQYRHDSVTSKDAGTIPGRRSHKLQGLGDALLELIECTWFGKPLQMDTRLTTIPMPNTV